MIKEIVEFMDANEGIENHFIKEKFKEIYLVNSKDENFLAIFDNKSKTNSLLKINKNRSTDLTPRELKKLIFLENNSKALPRKQLNKDKGVGGAGVFLFSAYYEKIEDNVFLSRKKGDYKISFTKGIEYQLDSAITYSQNIHLKKIIQLIKKNILKLIAKNYKNLQYAIKNELIAEKGNIKMACFVSNRTISIFRNFYLQRKVFSYDVEKNKNKFIEGKCHICNTFSDTLSSPAFLSNYGDSFSSKISLGIEFNQIICPNCAAKLEKFRYMTENKLTNPFPLFLDKKNLFSEQITILEDKGKKKSYREIIKSVYYKNPKDLKNYYLINYRAFLSSGSWKLEVKDLDYIENFEYMTSIKIENFLEIKHSFILNDFYDKSLSVFQFEKIINELVFENKLQNNYFSDYKDIKITYKKIDSNNSNNILKNYLIKYRQNFYDYIYKSHQSALRLIDFREMLLDIIYDNIRHDDKNKEGYSIYENEIKEKLNLLFSLEKTLKKEKNLQSDELKKLKEKLKDTLGFWEEYEDGKKIEPRFVKGRDSIESNEDNDKFFAFLVGQFARYLLSLSKSKKENLTHADFTGFLDWYDSKLLKNYVIDIFNKYAHELRYSYLNGKKENAISIIQTYRDDLNMDSVKEYMIAGYFSDNYFYEKKEKLQEESEDE